MAKKTLKGWEKSEIHRYKYLQAGDEIDEALFLDISECVAPEYSDQLFVQNGEASSSYRVDALDYKRLYYHETAIATNDGRYYYLGELPSFTQLQVYESIRNQK